MPVDIVTIPCLSDNYAYLLKGPDGVVLIDAPEAAPIRQALAVRGWGLDTILITHHHHDHVGAIAALKAEFGATVIGPRAEASKIDGLDQLVAGGDQGGSGAGAWQVLDVPGHTLGHVAFHFPGAHAAFTADSLMALGCGRIFEGTPPMMYDSLCALAALPPETMVYSGHEYTQANARFALQVAMNSLQNLGEALDANDHHMALHRPSTADLNALVRALFTSPSIITATATKGKP